MFDRLYARVLGTGVSVMLCAGAAAPAVAQTAPPPRAEGALEASFVGVTGNASSNTFGLGADVILRPDTWFFRNRASFVRNESSGALIAKAFQYVGRGEKFLSSHASAFAEYTFFRDPFAGVLPRQDVSLGVAVDAIRTDRQRWALDVGAGYLYERRPPSGDVSSGSYVAGTFYKVNLSPTADLTTDLRLTGLFEASDAWRVEHSVGLATKIAAGLSLKVSTTVRLNNAPPPGFKKRDTVSAVTLVTKFAR